ncbi:MAG: hypothetical protein LBG67_00170 [Campylobacteraceae bacterium]|jgi:uncharacterized membrane protein YjjP (DUF1212 family)|nr:hypothetical protein [Campylobacteraceae bacterium]
MATAMEYDVLREIVSDISGIFSRVLEEDDEEGQKDLIKVRKIRKILHNVEYQFIDYEGVAEVLVKIRDKYRNRPYSKEFIAECKEADEELGRE